jgi:hypothetical protein
MEILSVVWGDAKSARGRPRTPFGVGTWVATLGTTSARSAVASSRRGSLLVPCQATLTGRLSLAAWRRPRWSRAETAMSRANSPLLAYVPRPSGAASLNSEAAGEWRNGRRASLRSWYRKRCAGSTPASPTRIVARANMRWPAPAAHRDDTRGSPWRSLGRRISALA